MAETIDKTIVVDSRMIPPPCPLPKLDYPVSFKENFELMLQHKKPYWVPVPDYEYQMTFCPHDNDRPAFGTSGKDWFGVSWTYVDQVGGQMVTPNTFIMKDPSEWREKLVFPDLDKMDFSVGAEEARRRQDPDKLTGYVMQDGLFERLLSLCPTEEGLCWLLEDPEDAADYFNAMADYKIALIHKLMKEWAPIDILINSDDWGTQISTFMSPETYKALILPPMKRVAEVVKSYGLYYDCHSCGKVEPLVPCMIDIGFDYWEAQPMNDLKAFKKKYGDKLGLRLALDPYILQKPGVTDDEIKHHVHQMIEDYGAGGGLMLSYKTPDPHIYTLVASEIFNFSREFYGN